MRCTYCGSQNHPTSHCPKTWDGQGARNTLKCSYCGSDKHNYEACPKIRARPTPGGVMVRD